MNISKNARAALTETKNGGSMEAAGVAGILLDIAQSKENAMTDQELILCAKEIKAAAERFVLLLTALGAQDASVNGPLLSNQ
jgi:hypothetical protein